MTPRISNGALAEVQKALGQYESLVNISALTTATKATYDGHARAFVRWLAGGNDPGSSKQTQPRPSPRSP
jgi:hypothetical protein